MRAIARAAALVALILGLAACASAAEAFQRELDGDCLPAGAQVPPGTSLFPERITGDETVEDNFYTQVNSARGFSVKYYPTYKVVTNNIEGETYVLTHCGVAPPPAADFPAGTKFFTVPLVSVSVPTTVPFALLEMLGVEDRVHDVSEFVSAACGQKLLECQGAAAAAPSFDMLSNATALNDAYAAVTDAMFLDLANPEVPEAVAAGSLTNDTGVLSRAEWVKFYALFFNKDKQASEIFDGIKAEYEATKAEALKGAGAAGAKKAPVVAWAMHSADFGPGFPEAYSLSFDPHNEQLTQDAGGVELDAAAIKKAHPEVQEDEAGTLKFVWGQPGAFASQDAARAAFVDALRGADIVVDETYAMDPTAYDAAALLKDWGLTEEQAQSLPAYANQKIFRTDGTVAEVGPGNYGSDWFEGAIARPGQVLKDFVRAIQPELQKDLKPTWVRNVFTEKPRVATSAACKSSCEQIKARSVALICPAVRLCAAGQAPALLTASEPSCQYAACGDASALPDTAAAAAPAGTTNGAGAAAPAALLGLALAAAVQLLF